MREKASILAAAAILAGGLAACSNASSTSTSTTSPASPATMAKAPAKMKTAKNGGAVFNTNCASCHQSNGQGNVGPSLAGNALVTGDPAKVIHIVKNGLNGAIKVNGKSYNGMMPPWKGTLSNDDIAAVITYIRSSWGNHASAVTAMQVSKTP